MSRLCHTCMAVKLGWARCSYCKLDLSKLTMFFNGPEKDSNMKADKRYLGAESEGPRDEVIASHLVEYLVVNGSSMGVITWPEPFDLARARSIAQKSVQQAPAFQMITLVRTSVRSLDSHEYRKLAKGFRSIITSPDISLDVSTTSIRILSKDIIRDISDVVSYYPAVKLNGQTMHLEEPYSIIAHHQQLLESRQNLSKSTSHLIGFVKESMFKDNIREEEAQNKDGFCTFPMLWLLYKPGETVYAEIKGELFAFVIGFVNSPHGLFSSLKAMHQKYEIVVWNLDFDGHYVGRCSRSLFIEPFEGTRDISTLKVVPSRFIDKKDGGETRRRLERLGRQWYELLPGRAIQYSGLGRQKGWDRTNRYVCSTTTRRVTGNGDNMT